MDTPICNFVQGYVKSDSLRLHMPGHKGAAYLGMEPLDITEIAGADSLYEAEGIIAQSEENASFLFGCKTLYSTEGSSLCIRSMLYLVTLYAKQNGRKPIIAAGRNVHKTFLSAAALLDLDVMWLYPKGAGSYLSCDLDAAELERTLRNVEEIPVAVYVTNPDYLGNIIDIAPLAKVCHQYGILLIVDNAHGAYLKFLPESRHPIDLGADICCDSAHKTLPVLTGGAYLHISPNAPAVFIQQAKAALALFGSTSPSYLILQSLDAANRFLTEYPGKLRDFLPKVEALKERLRAHGYCLYGNEPLKLTISAKSYGYTGKELSVVLMDNGVVCEFADPDFLVLMLTPETADAGLVKLENTLLQIVAKTPIVDLPPRFQKAERAVSIREAVFSVSELVPISECKGRVLAATTVSCPPAVPILVCGERIDALSIECFRYYGVEACSVIQE